MPSSLTRSPELLLREAEEVRDKERRYEDLCLIFRRKKTGEIIVNTGGRWDNLRRRYLDGPSPTCRILDLEESQIEFARWFAIWLHAYKNEQPRDTSLVLTAGERRGGKTTIGLFCTIALAISVPDTVTWIVSSTYQERDEIERAIARFFPRSWYVYRGAPRYRFLFPNGSVLRNISGDDPDVLKQGQVDLVLINEAQKMSSRVLSNSLPGTIDRGGLSILAANPADRIIGVWVNDLKEAIDLKKFQQQDGTEIVKFFGFSANQNSEIDQNAKSRVGKILRVVDPRAAAADDEGLWLPVGDVAYPAFKTVDHVKAAPTDGDFTRLVTKNKAGREYDYVNGADFQATPHMAGVSLKIFRNSSGENVYSVVGEILREGTEDDFLDTVDESGLWIPENTVWVGDSSGTWQTGDHKNLRGRVSFDIFKSRRWHINPPQKAKTENKRPSNPAVADRVGLVNHLLTQGRLSVDPAAPRTVLALKKCALKYYKPSGKYAHITDALGYALWWLEPRPRAALTHAGPEAFSVPLVRRGSDVI